MSRKPNGLHSAVVAVAGVTFLAGLGALLTPRLLLQLLAVSAGGIGEFFLRLVGMLVVLFGGLLSHALIRPTYARPILFWAGLEKVGFAVALAAGYLTSTLGSLAVAIAAVDLVSGLILFAYRRAATKAASATIPRG